MDQRRWILFISVTTGIYLLFYVFYLLPLQNAEQQKRELLRKKAAEFRASHPELGTTGTLTLTSGTLPSLRPGREIETTPTVAEQRPSSPVVEVPATDIFIETQRYRVTLTSRGGRPTSWRLLEILSDRAVEEIEMVPQRPESPDRELPLEVIITETRERGYPEFSSRVYQHTVRKLDDGSTEVVFVSPVIRKMQLTKTYVFHPDSFVTDLRVVLHNLDEKAPCAIVNMMRGNEQGLGITWGPGVRQFLPDEGASVYYANAIYGTAGRVGYAQPKDATEKAEVFFRGAVPWAGVTDKFFMAAVIPQDFKGTAAQLVVRLKNLYSDREKQTNPVHSNPFTVVLYNDRFTLEPQREAGFNYAIFVGAKRPALLREIGKQTHSDLNEVLFYDSWFGWMRQIKLGLMYSLAFLYSRIHNYGLAIVILTLLIRLVMHPVAHKGMKMQAKTMAEMQKIKPEMDEISKKYKNDPARRNQETMALYKKHNISPLAPLRGCLPMLVQIPIFFALYSLLNQAIDLRGASFLWIRDLSGPDKLVDLTQYGLAFMIPFVGWHVNAFNVLPILMGASQYFMSKLTPTPGRDQAQQKQMMAIMTLLFPIMMYNFPSGLFVYWLINNVWQSIHQLIANRGAAKPSGAEPAAAKT